MKDLSESGNGTVYNSNYARAAAYFVATCAPRPEGEQRQAAYDLITGIYRGIIQDPEHYAFHPSPDVHFSAWEPQRNRQEDVKKIREPIAKIEALISELYKLVAMCNADAEALVPREGEEIKPSARLKKTLYFAGAVSEADRIVLPRGCAEGLCELARISAERVIHITDGAKEDKPYFIFSRCVFKPDGPWLAMAFDSAMHANGEIVRLCREFEARGYRRIDCKDGKRISLDYVKSAGTTKKEEPVKMSWADKYHYGIELSYEDLRLEPYFIWLRMPSFADVLRHISDFPPRVSAFITDNTKNCDACRYCVQTDKTGTRQLAAVPVNNIMKCPYYPSFTMNWRTITPERCETMLMIFDTVYGDKAQDDTQTSTSTKNGR